MSRTINGMAHRETIQVEAYTGLDGEGAPAYAASADTEAHVRLVEDFITKGDGTRTPTHLTLYFPPDAALVASRRDRITVDSGTFIAMEVKPVRRLGASRTAADLDHTKVKCRRESTS